MNHQDRSARISAQLGMPHGTATNRLRKRVMFHLLKRLGENVCSKCEQIIATSDDLSLEHVLPWEGRSAELFWDMNNIRFSHTRCNTPHVRHGGSLRKIKSPEGMNWCRTHKKHLPVEEFSTQPSRWNGLAYDCRECVNASKREARLSPDS